MNTEQYEPQDSLQLIHNVPFSTLLSTRTVLLSKVIPLKQINPGFVPPLYTHSSPNPFF